MLRLPPCCVERELGSWYTARLQGAGEDEPQVLALRSRPWLLGDWALSHILLFKVGTGTGARAARRLPLSVSSGFLPSRSPHCS